MSPAEVAAPPPPPGQLSAWLWPAEGALTEVWLLWGLQGRKTGQICTQAKHSLEGPHIHCTVSSGAVHGGGCVPAGPLPSDLRS